MPSLPPSCAAPKGELISPASRVRRSTLVAASAFEVQNLEQSQLCGTISHAKEVRERR
jgi:hypothetical protein